MCGAGGGICAHIPNDPLLSFPYSQTRIHKVLPGTRPVLEIRGINPFESDKESLNQLRSNGMNWAKNNLNSPAEYERFTAAISNLLK